MPEGPPIDPEELGVTPDQAEPQSQPEPEPTSQDLRNVTLRNAAGYFHQHEQQRYEDLARLGRASKISRIKARLKAESAEANSLALHKEDWDKKINPKEGRIRSWLRDRRAKRSEDGIRLSEREQRVFKLAAIYREAYRFRDESIKLMREAPFATPERQAEIERQLDQYHAQLMRLAHTESFQVLPETEEVVKYKNERRRKGESRADYRQRIAKKSTKVKDYKVKFSDDLSAEDEGAILQKEAERDEWARDFHSHEGRRDPETGRRKFKSGLEGLINRVEDKVGQPESARYLIELYRNLRRYKAKDLEKLGIKLEYQRNQTVYREVDPTKKKVNQLLKTAATATYTISVKSAPGTYDVFRVYSDGVKEGPADKLRVVRQPTKAGQPEENISVRHTTVRTNPDKYEPTIVTVNPSGNDPRYIEGLEALGRLQQRVETELAPNGDVEPEDQAVNVEPSDDDEDDLQQ